MGESANKINKGLVLKWLITVIVPIIIWMIPVTEAFTPQIKTFLVITVFSIFTIAFELMPTIVPSIFMPMLYLLFGVAPAATIYSSWADVMPWMFLGILTIANTFQRVGLVDRIAYWCITKIGGGFKGLAIAVLIAGILLSVVLPGGNAHAPLIFCVYGICLAMGWGKSKEATVLMMYVLLGTYTTIKFFLSPYLFLTAKLGAPYELGEMNFFTFLYHNWIFIIWLVLAAILIYKLIGPEGNMPSKDYFKEKYAEMGKMSSDEKKASVIALVLVALIMTTSIHGIPMGWCFVLMACVMYLPFIRVANEDDIKDVRYSIVFFVAACMTIGSVGTEVGVGQLIANAILPYMHGIGETTFMFLVLVLGGLGNFVLTPLAILATLTAPITQLAAELGIPHLPVWYTLMTSTNLIVLPYEYIAYLFTFSFGLMSMKDFIKVYSIKSICMIIFTLVVALPWWRFIGIL